MQFSLMQKILILFALHNCHAYSHINFFLITNRNVSKKPSARGSVPDCCQFQTWRLMKISYTAKKLCHTGILKQGIEYLSTVSYCTDLSIKAVILAHSCCQFHWVWGTRKFAYKLMFKSFKVILVLDYSQKKSKFCK